MYVAVRGIIGAGDVEGVEGVEGVEEIFGLVAAAGSVYLLPLDRRKVVASTSKSEVDMKLLAVFVSQDI